MAEYTWFDYIIFGIFFLTTILGLARGLFREVISLVVLAVAFIVTIKFTAPVADFLNNSQGAQDVISVISKTIGTDWSTPLSSVTLALTLLVLFVGCLSVGEAVNYFAALNTYMTPSISFMYRILGGAIGMIRGYGFNIVLVLLMQITPLTQEAAWTQSYFVPRILPLSNQLGNMIQSGGFNKKSL